MLIKTEPVFLYGEAHELEINPNHFLADHVICAFPFNRPIPEDVGPYAPLGTWGSQTTFSSLTQHMVQCKRGWAHNPGSSGGYTYDNPMADNLGGSGRPPLCMMAWIDYPAFISNANFKGGFTKGSGGDGVAWTGGYGNANGIVWQSDDGSSAQTAAFSFFDANIGDTVAWCGVHDYSASFCRINGFHTNVDGTSSITWAETTSYDSSNTSAFEWGLLNHVGVSFEGNFFASLVLNKRLSVDAEREILKEPYQIYRRKVERSYNFYKGSGAPPAPAAGVRQLILTGVGT